MKITTRSKYGLRAAVMLARRYDQGPVGIREIATTEGISPVYLEQLLATMRRRGLVKSVRGPGGGYQLSNAPARVTVLSIFEALEGAIAPVACMPSARKTHASCGRSARCGSKKIWVLLAQKITQTLAATTLQDLCEEAARER